jgi:hypothetical protein
MSLILEIEYLSGIAFAAIGPDREAPDWPPQPIEYSPPLSPLGPLAAVRQTSVWLWNGWNGCHRRAFTLRPQNRVSHQYFIRAAQRCGDEENRRSWRAAYASETSTSPLSCNTTRRSHGEAPLG